MRSVELFAGAGGLAIGMANSGFNHAAIVEWNRDACETFRENHNGENWPVIEGDVRQFDYGHLKDVVVVSGGPPCQPFSLGGKHKGYLDEPDMFPEAVRAVRELRPKAFIFENVKGLMRETFSEYFEYILMQLQHPGLKRKGTDESWQDHRSRLERHQTSRGAKAEYNVLFRLLNAAKYGVPQRRERVFFVGLRSDLGIEWTSPRRHIPKMHCYIPNGSPVSIGIVMRFRCANDQLSIPDKLPESRDFALKVQTYFTKHRG